jgi:hypothetical protein
MFIFRNILLGCTFKKSKEGKIHDTVFRSFSLVFLASGKGKRQAYDERSGEMLTEIVFPT